MGGGSHLFHFGFICFAKKNGGKQVAHLKKKLPVRKNDLPVREFLCLDSTF
jgi:hypothetical protein